MKLDFNCSPTTLFQIVTGVFSQCAVRKLTSQATFQYWASLNLDILDKVSKGKSAAFRSALISNENCSHLELKLN